MSVTSWFGSIGQPPTLTFRVALVSRAARLVGAAARLFAAAGVVGGAACSAGSAQLSPDRGQDAVVSTSDGLRAFDRMLTVFQHPRCQNCHPSDDRPRQGDERRVHFLNVRRGPEDRGVVAMRCSTCHADGNQDYVAVPGAPHWRLAPQSMGWMGLGARDLCFALLDREKNGGKSLPELVRHLEADPLVAWGWAPGTTRTPVPLSRQDWQLAVDAWARAGAPCPEAEAAP